MLKTFPKPASVSRMHDGICGPFSYFSFSSVLVEVVISLVVSGCVLFLLIVLLLGIICWQKEPISSQGYRHVVNQEDGAESWQKYKLLPRRSASLSSWNSSDDDELWGRFSKLRLTRSAKEARDDEPFLFKTEKKKKSDECLSKWSRPEIIIEMSFEGPGCLSSSKKMTAGDPFCRLKKTCCFPQCGLISSQPSAESCLVRSGNWVAAEKSKKKVRFFWDIFAKM